jgi:hypothetical protein
VFSQFHFHFVVIPNFTSSAFNKLVSPVIRDDGPPFVVVMIPVRPMGSTADCRDRTDMDATGTFGWIGLAGREWLRELQRREGFLSKLRVSGSRATKMTN